MRVSLTKDYHINLGILRNNLYQYKNILKSGGQNGDIDGHNAEIDLRRRMKRQGRSLIEFLMKEHMLRDHGTELNQDNFDGIAPFKCGQCFRSYFDWNKYQSHQSLHHRNADFIVKRTNLPVPVRNTAQPNVPTIQVNQSNVIFQQATAATKKAVIYPNRINLTDGVELVNRLKCPGSLRNHKLKSCSYETFFPEMIQHHIGTFLLQIWPKGYEYQVSRYKILKKSCSQELKFF